MGDNTFRALCWQEGDTLVIQFVGAPDDVASTVVGLATQCDDRRDVLATATDYLAALLEVDEASITVLVRFIDLSHSGTVHGGQLPLYIRVGENGDEHLVGSVSIDNPALVMSAVSGLLQSVAMTVTELSEEEAADD